MRSLPPLSAVRVFEAAARNGNFTRAAEELGMTQAAVSYQVKLLEERLGSGLFARTGRRVELTALGRRIAPLVRDAFDTLDQAFAVARRDDEAVLSISCSTTFASNWMAPRLGAFQMQRANLAVRLHTDNALVDFARDEVDVAIRSGSGHWPGLASHFLMRMPIAAYASPDFLASVPPITSAETIMHLPRISPSDFWWDMWLKQMGGMVQHMPDKGAIRLDSQLMEGRAAIAGHGFAILNPAMWKAEIASGQLVNPLGRHAFDKTDYWLVFPEYRRNAPKIRAFRDWMLAEIARDADGDSTGTYVRPEAAA